MKNGVEGVKIVSEILMCVEFVEILLVPEIYLKNYIEEMKVMVVALQQMQMKTQ